MRRNTAKDDIIFEATLHEFERFVYPEAVINENSWFLVHLYFSLGIKYKFDQSKLILESVYPNGEHAKCYPGVGYVVYVLRWVAAGQIISGKRDLPFAEIHFIRLTPAPL